MVLRSTARAVSGIEASGAGRVSGAATIAVSASATTPPPHSSHFKTLKEPRSSHFDMTNPLDEVEYRELYTTELSVMQVPICGYRRNPYLANQPRNAESIGR